jgi:hypothetical protein
VLWLALTSSVEFTLGHSPDETVQVEVVDELVAKFWKQEEGRLQLEWLS